MMLGGGHAGTALQIFRSDGPVPARVRQAIKELGQESESCAWN